MGAGEGIKSDFKTRILEYFKINLVLFLSTSSFSVKTLLGKC